MGFAKPIEQIFIKLSRYIYVSKRYYTRRLQVNALISKLVKSMWMSSLNWQVNLVL